MNQKDRDFFSGIANRLADLPKVYGGDRRKGAAYVKGSYGPSLEGSLQSIADDIRNYLIEEQGVVALEHFEGNEGGE